MTLGPFISFFPPYTKQQQKKAYRYLMFSLCASEIVAYFCKECYNKIKYPSSFFFLRFSIFRKRLAIKETAGFRPLLLCHIQYMAFCSWPLETSEMPWKGNKIHKLFITAITFLKKPSNCRNPVPLSMSVHVCERGRHDLFFNDSGF